MWTLERRLVWESLSAWWPGQEPEVTRAWRRGRKSKLYQWKMHFSGEKKVPNQIPNFTNMHVYLRVAPTLVILRGAGCSWAP